MESVGGILVYFLDVVVESDWIVCLGAINYLALEVTLHLLELQR